MFLGLNLPIVGHHIREVRTLTLNRGLAQRGPALTRGRLAARTPVPTLGHLRTPEEAEARAGITVLGPGLTDTTALGHGHPTTDGTILDQGPRRPFGASLPVNVLHPKGKQNVSILTDTEKSHHRMTSRLIMAGMLTFETHLKKNVTENGRENTESGMKNITKVMLLELSPDHQQTERTFLRRGFYHLQSGILPSQEAAEKIILVDKVTGVET